MSLQIAHLGPTGTNTESAALAYAQWIQAQSLPAPTLCPQVSNAQTLYAVINGAADLAVVPVENSIEGAVAMTLDTLWEVDDLTIQQALTLPITHALMSAATTLDQIKVVRSHPQALGQCQRWLHQNLPTAKLIPTNSTTEPLAHLRQDPSAAAISAPRAAELYQVEILASPINDHPENCTRFWVVGSRSAQTPLPQSLVQDLVPTHTSVAFSLPANQPGALVNALQIFAKAQINLSRIESRPTKRSLGEYVFFIDLEGGMDDATVAESLSVLASFTETLKILGSYALLPITIPGSGVG